MEYTWHRKRVPYYWCKPEWVGGKLVNTVVHSDDDRFPIVARISGFGEDQIDEAQNVIDDLNAGRANPRKLAAALTNA